MRLDMLDRIKLDPHSAKIDSGLVIGQTPAPDQNVV